MNEMFWYFLIHILSTLSIIAALWVVGSSIRSELSYMASRLLARMPLKSKHYSNYRVEKAAEDLEKAIQEHVETPVYKCTYCGFDKPVTQYYRKNNSRGHDSVCRPCRLIQDAARRDMKAAEKNQPNYANCE